MQYRILGPLEVESDGTSVPLGSPQRRSLLAALVIRANKTVSTDWLIDSLWGEEPPATAAHSIQVHVSELRKQFAPAEVIITRPQGYELQTEPDSVDAVRFERDIATAVSLLAVDPKAAATQLENALALWRGPPLVDVEYLEFAQPSIRRLEEIRLTAIEALAEADLETGRLPEAIHRLRELIEMEPLREQPRRLLMTALYRSGRHAEALRAYQEFSSLLGEETGIEPSPELRRLEEQILLQDPALDGPARPVEHPAAAELEDTEIRNPYKGLRAFREKDRADFHGRHGLVEKLLDKLSGDDLMVALIGPSGSGKSSVVRAGLIPALRERAANQLVATMVPGAEPFAELEAALLRAAPDPPPTLLEILTDGDLGILRGVLRVLPDDEDRLLLIIDQFEELFSLFDDDDARARFLRALVKALEDPHSRLRLLVSLRADYYDRPLLHPEFGALLSRNVVHVLPLTAHELEEAAVAPAAAVGVELEPAVVAELVAEVAARPGALPLFQYTLTDLFEEREGRVLTLAAYQKLGGLRGALTGRAEDLYGKCDAEQQAAARQLFLRLVTIGEADEIARRRVHAREIASIEIDTVTLQSVLDLFGAHRLLSFDRDPVSGDPTVEVAHEALLREWDRLQDWIEDARADLRLHAALAAAAAEWERENRNPDFLIGGSRLTTYEDWAPTAAIRLNEGENAFLEASVVLREAEHAAEADRAAREVALERRARRRLRGFIGTGAALIAVVAVVLVMAIEPRPTRIGLVTQGLESGFDEMAAAGLERAANDFGIDGSEITVLADVAENLATMADSGYELIVLPGVVYAEGLMAAAPEHPDTAFAILDTAIELPNVTSILFAEEQGSFLVGAAAALESETGVIGFLGGMPIPVVEGFRAGFEAGAWAADPDVVVLVAWLTEDPLNFSGAFGNPGGGGAAAGALFDAGADVIFHAAGASGYGLFEEASDRTAATGEQHWAIGADTDQYLEVAYIYRPHILTSMVKRLDTAVYEAVRRYETEGPVGGIVVLDLAADAVGYSTSGDHLHPDTIDSLEELRVDVANGTIVVPVTPGGPGRVVSLTAAEEAAVEFDGESCSYDGPSPLATGTTVSLRANNLTAGSAYLAVLEIPTGVTLEMLRETAATWRVSDGPPEGIEGGELGGLSLWPESMSDTVFVVGRQQFAIQVIYPLGIEGRVFTCELVSIAEE